MKACLLLGFLCIGASAAMKISLEDIERDNLRAEGTTKSGNVRAEEAKYPSKSEVGQQQQQQYRGPSQYHGPSNPPVTYVTPAPLQTVPQEAYIRSHKYAVKEQAYQSQQNDALPEQILPARYYNEYQQQLPTRGVAPNAYESQQLLYQPEVTVGNHLQSVQQKTVTAKYGKDASKGTFYVDIPAMHLLAYYPSLNIDPGKAGGILLPRLATPATEHVSIPLYTSALSQMPIAAAKPAYQIRYAPRPSTASSIGLSTSTKVTKEAIFPGPVTSKKYTAAQSLLNLPVPTYAPSDQSAAHGRQLLYTRAYIAPSQPQARYVSQLVYAQPTPVYMHATPVYSDVYARPTIYVQDNTGHSHGPVKHADPAEPLDSATENADAPLGQDLSQYAAQTVSQNYVKDPEEPSGDLVPPRLAAQDFQSEATLLAGASQDEESVSEQNHVGLSEPRSLLDSYVPSKLIAAQDAARYQERPIQLESGFLPSKENFVQKKRRTD